MFAQFLTPSDWIKWLWCDLYATCSSCIDNTIFICARSVNEQVKLCQTIICSSTNLGIESRELQTHATNAGGWYPLICSCMSVAFHLDVIPVPKLFADGLLIFFLPDPWLIHHFSGNLLRGFYFSWPRWYELCWNPRPAEYQPWSAWLLSPYGHLSHDQSLDPQPLVTGHGSCHFQSIEPSKFDASKGVATAMADVWWRWAVAVWGWAPSTQNFSRSTGYSHDISVIIWSVMRSIYWYLMIFGSIYD